MISDWLGRTPPTHFAHALHRETEGNPFFIEEVLRHLIEVGRGRRDRVGAPGFVHGAGHPRRRAGGDRAAPGHAVAGGAPHRDDGCRDRPVVLDRGARRPCRAARRAPARGARRGRGAPDRRGGSRCSGALHIRPRADSGDALRVAERAPASGAAPPDRRDPRAAARRRPPSRLSASSRTTSSRPPSPDRRPRPSTTRSARRGGRWPRWRTRRPSAISTARSRPCSSRSPPTRRPAASCCSASASPTARRASSIRAAPPSKPPRSSRGRRASGSTSPARRWASAGVGSSRAPPTRRSSALLRGGARRAARDRYRAPGQAARPPRHGASLLRRARALPGAGAAGRGAGPAAG